MRQAKRLLFSAAITLAVAGCASQDEIVVSNTQSAPASMELSGDCTTASFDEDGKIVGREPLRDPLTPEQRLSSVSFYLSPTAMEEGDIDGDYVEVRLQGVVTSTRSDIEKFDQSVRMNLFAANAARRAIGNDAVETYLAINVPFNGLESPPFVYSAILVEDGRVELAGNCASSNEQQLRDFHGDSFDSLAAQVPIAPAGDVSAIERVIDNETSDDEIVLLNSADVSEEFLDDLEEAVLVFSVDKQVTADQLICVEATAGWNDCLPTGLELFQEGQRVVHDIFLSADGVLKVWLLDSVNIADKNGRTLIGEITIDGELLAGTELAVMSVTIEPGERSANARISDAIAIEDLDPGSELGSLIVGSAPETPGR